jgi:hypothetical protein
MFEHLFCIFSAWQDLFFGETWFPTSSKKVRRFSDLQFCVLGTYFSGAVFFQCDKFVSQLGLFSVLELCVLLWGLALA